MHKLSFSETRVAFITQDISQGSRWSPYLPLLSGENVPVSSETIPTDKKILFCPYTSRFVYSSYQCRADEASQM